MKILMLTLAIVVVLVAISVVLLCVKVIFVKGGRFPNTHVHGNPALRKKGIRCASEMDNKNKV